MASRTELLQLNTFICRLDACLSLAIAKDTFNLLVAPTFTDLIADTRIVGARNLLAEFQTNSFNPINYTFATPDIKLVADASGTGKTTWLQTLGQLCYLA